MLTHFQSLPLLPGRLWLLAVAALLLAPTAVAADPIDDLEAYLQSQNQCMVDEDCGRCSICATTAVVPLPFPRDSVIVRTCFAKDCPVCRLNSDCAFDEECNAGVCVPGPQQGECSGEGCSCQSNRDCFGVGLRCISGVCADTVCDTSLDCPLLGFDCVSGECVVDVTKDRDRDGVPDVVDSCPDRVNTAQDDQDRDGRGDLCDGDLDGDGIPTEEDNCPTVANATQADRNDDGVGDECQPDFDGDGVPDDIDNCLFTSGLFANSLELSTNPSQRDTDSDGLGDHCDFDDDDDGVADIFDPCPRTIDPTCTTDSDGDGIPDGQDTSPAPILVAPGLPTFPGFP